MIAAFGQLAPGGPLRREEFPLERPRISFEIADPAKAQNDARVAAVAAAETSARAMASAAHVTLGPVVAISDAMPSSPVFYGYARLSAAADLATPVQAGTQDVTVTVTVVFEVE